MVFEDIGQQLIYDDEYLTPIQVGTAYERLGSDSGDVPWLPGSSLRSLARMQLNLPRTLPAPIYLSLLLAISFI
jgi:hypothetical protein